MEHYGKEKNIYHGIAIPFILMVLIPIGVYFLLYCVITKYTDLDRSVICYMCLALSGVVGVLFELSCVVIGFIHDLFVAFIKRVGNFFSNVKIFKKKAFAWYFDDFKENGGIIIWIFLIILLATAAVSIYGFVKFGIWYSAH